MESHEMVPPLLNPEGGDDPAGGDVPPRVTCINCNYSLAGLDVSGKCPECGAAIDESARPGPFDFMDRRDANLLSIGVQCLLGAVGLGLAALLIFVVIAVSRGGWMGLAALGVPLGIASVLVWLCGWHAIARVRAPGKGPAESFARQMCTFVAWAQTLAFIPLLVSVLSLVFGRAALNDALVFLTTVVATGCTLVFGHWRLKSLAARTGDFPMNAAGAAAAVLNALLLLTTSVVLDAVFSRDGGLFGNEAFVALLAIDALTAVIAALAWGSFLVAVCKSANLRAGPSSAIEVPESL
jgi:hypothetical protein